MQIVYKKKFIKSYKKRVKPNIKLERRLQRRIKLLQSDILNPILRVHSLTGDLNGLYAFSITGDIRVLFKIDQDLIIFHDIGTHAQVYRM